MPLAHLQMNVVRSLLHETPLAALERPKHEVVFFAIEADGQVIAVRFEIEENSGALIELAAEETKSH